MKLVLVNKSVDCFPVTSVNDNVIVNIYRNEIQTKIMRILRKLHLMSFLPFKSLWLNKEVRNIDKYDKIIIFDTGNVKYIIDYLSKRNRNVKIILWYWGAVSISVNPNLINRNKCSIWTFDKDDSVSYGMKLNSQFFFKENIRFSSKIKWDVCFIGTEKNRLSLLISLENKFNILGLTTYFHIVKSNSIYTSSNEFNYSKPISYNESLTLVSETKAILDIVSNDQNGLTLRPLEALFLKKKLITNYANIKSTLLYKLNSINIFILGEDDDSKLIDFINSSFDETNYLELTKYYSFDSWINRFE